MFFYAESLPGIQLFKDSNGNSRTTWKTTPLMSFWCLSWKDFKYCSGVSIVDYEQINSDWVVRKQKNLGLNTDFSEIESIAFACIVFYQDQFLSIVI